METDGEALKSIESAGEADSPNKTVTKSDDAKAAKGKKDAKGKGKEVERVESPPIEDAERAKNDPNYRKFIPGITHLRKELVSYASELSSHVSYAMSIKKDDSSGLIIEDNQYDSLKSEIVDFAFGSGITSYLNLSGLGKPEKSCKVARYTEILNNIRVMK